MKDEGITAVVGEGAIGITLTTALGTGTDHRLLVIAKPNSAAVIRREGIHRTGILGNASLSPKRVEVYDTLEKIPNIAINRVLVAVKCHQMSQVAQEPGVPPAPLRMRAGNGPLRRRSDGPRRELAAPRIGIIGQRHERVDARAVAMSPLDARVADIGDEHATTSIV